MGYLYLHISLTRIDSLGDLFWLDPQDVIKQIQLAKIAGALGTKKMARGLIQKQ